MSEANVVILEVVVRRARWGGATLVAMVGGLGFGAVVKWKKNVCVMNFHNFCAFYAD